MKQSHVVLPVALTACLLAASPLGAQEAPRFPALPPEDAWKLLPRDNPPLPAWALVLAQSLPRTTGAMLELDYFHRAKNPLGDAWSAKLRWVAADAAGCEYTKSYAEADLRRALKNPKDVVRLLKGKPAKEERAALAFARKMTEAPYTVTDAEVAELLAQFGPEKLVAMVHTLAHANFQNRMFLALGVSVEKGGPLPPRDLGLDVKARAKIATASRPPWDELAKTSAPADLSPSRLDWRPLTFADLEKAMALQKTRKPRIEPLPPERLAHLPPEVRDHATRVVWSNISLGHQGDMTNAWFSCMRTFQQEAKLNRVFSGSMFWVITRSNECFY